jgi:DNA-binding CsgD family transcriptional regulator/tetratricopeptide (TPR) repeat protein
MAIEVGSSAAGKAARTGDPWVRLPGAWPLVGRREELAFVSDLLRQGVGGIVLAGAAGVGKTRLAREILEAAEAKGFATAWATATQAVASIPYGALAHLLPEPGSEADGPLAFFQRAARTLMERAEGRLLALAIDDAHLLDSASAALVQRLAAGAGAFVVVTVRTGEVVPDAIVGLWKDGANDYLELQPLSEDDVARLLAGALGGEVEAGMSGRLWDATRGNPLYLRELVSEGLARGALVDGGGVWCWRGPVVPGRRLLELIEARIGRLEAAERELLEFVGAEEPLEARVLEQLVPPDVLAGLERCGLLEAVAAGRRLELRFAHPLYGEAIRTRTPEIRARELHRRLAEALEQCGTRRRRDLLRITVHRLEGGGRTSAAMLAGAARQAEAVFDYPLAERLARQAAESGGGVAAGILLGRALQGQGRFAEAEAVLAALARRVRADAQRSELAELRSGNLFWGLGRASRAEEVLRQSERAIADPSRREELVSLRVGFACAAGRPREALDAAASILERSGTSRRAVLRTLLHVVPGLAIVGQTDRALAASDEALAAASAFGAGLPFAPGHLVIGRLLALKLAGELGEAERLGTEGYERALGQGDQDSRALIAMFRGQVALEQGKVRTAAHWLREASEFFRGLDVIGFLAWCQADLARALALSGEAAEASSTLAEANAARGESVRIDRAALGRAAVWVAVANGELSEARWLALSTAEEAEALGQTAFAAVALHDLVRLGEPRAARSKLGEFARTCQGRLVPLYADHASALAEHAGDELEVVARRFEGLGAILLAAEALTDAADSYRAVGRAASARTAEVRARSLAALCEGGSTPATALSADELTPREREIAALAAAGLSNQAIADRLVLSKRTVENHLQHVFGKLGAASRGELPALLESRHA